MSQKIAEEVLLISQITGQPESDEDVVVVLVFVGVAKGNSGFADEAEIATATNAANVGNVKCGILAPLPHIPAHVINP